MTKTIIIVDDIYFVRKTIQEILVQAHYQVIAEADNGASAVDLYSKLRPDLVTMDVVMPEMSGIEACQKNSKNESSSKSDYDISDGPRKYDDGSYRRGGLRLPLETLHFSGYTESHGTCFTRRSRKSCRKC